MSLILPGQKDPEKKETKIMKIGEWFWNEITKARPGKGRDEIMNEWSWQLDNVDRGDQGETYTFRESEDWDIAWDDMMYRFEEDMEWDEDGTIAAAMAWWKRWCVKHGWVEVIDPRMRWVSSGRRYDFKMKGVCYDYDRPNFDDEMEEK